MVFNKKGLSMVVSAMILVAIVIALTGIVWISIDKLVNEELDKSEACFLVLDKTQFNDAYTCYNLSKSKMQFSIEVKDINIEELIISITMENSSRTFTMYNESRNITGLTNYPLGTNNVKLPGQNRGKTYFASEVDAFPSSIEIAPKINGIQCEISDSIFDIQDCSQ